MVGACGFASGERRSLRRSPTGLRYSLTLHDVDGTRLMGFDNAHGVGWETRFDHEHRYGRVADPVPYAFTGADALLTDFFAATERACRTAGGRADHHDGGHRG
nr:DUF6516 family protein [Azospirillum sp. INR13]